MLGSVETGEMHQPRRYAFVSASLVGVVCADVHWIHVMMDY